MKIIAVIVTYNGKKWYDKCFGSLMRSTIPIDIVVVDNASTDNTIEYITSKFPKIHVIKSDKNLGFAKANNIGINYALQNNADYVFLLNQDAWIEEKTINILLNSFNKYENVGIVSPMHLNGSYTDLDLGFCHYLDAKFISDLFFGRLQPDYPVSMVNAAAWLISKECLQNVGGFDVSLFKHYGEDDNYAQRVIYHKFKIIINTQCTICHDREFRTDGPLDSLFNKGNTYYEYIRRYSNVLYDFNISEIIRKKKRNLYFSCFLFRFKRIKRLKYEIELDKKIEISRQFNKSKGGGIHWLESL